MSPSLLSRFKSHLSPSGVVSSNSKSPITGSPSIVAVKSPHDPTGTFSISILSLILSPILSSNFAFPPSSSVLSSTSSASSFTFSSWKLPTSERASLLWLLAPVISKMSFGSSKFVNSLIRSCNWLITESSTPKSLAIKIISSKSSNRFSTNSFTRSSCSASALSSI